MSTSARRRNVPALGYDWLTAAYDPIVRVTTRERVFKRRLLEAARLDRARAALDVGCGSGTFAIMVKRSYPAIDVVGLDTDSRILQMARTKAAQQRVDVNFLEGSAEEMPFSVGTFDRVMSSLVFHHLTAEAKVRAAQEMLRVLSPAGELHVADWGVPSNMLMRALFLPVQMLDGFENTNGNVHGEVPLALEAAGFEPVERRGELSTIFGTLAWYSARKRS